MCIRDSLARAGLRDRFRYEGEFLPIRGDDGAVDGPGWQRVVDLLRRARLAPNPWPVGGASARVEAYLCGAPSVHIALRNDPASWGRPQPTLVDLPALGVERGSVRTPDEYVALCRRCLTDEAFADALARDQLAVARHVTDPHAYWRQLRDCHRWWLERRGRVAPAPAAHVERQREEHAQSAGHRI